MILTIVPTVAEIQYKEIILFCVKVHSHLHFEIQTLEGHIDSDNQPKYPLIDEIDKMSTKDRHFC